MEESVKTVTKGLLDKQVFNCFNCKKFMHSTKIMLVENIGDVCYECFEEKFTDYRSSQNTSLELIISALIFPCRYNNKGCEYWNSQNKLVSHEQSCKYRSKLCPMSTMSSCSWEGFPSELNGHFQLCHGDQIINFENNLFILEISLTERDITRLLVVRNLLFLLRIRTDIEKHKLMYTICNVKDGGDTFEYSVKHKGSTSDNYIKTKSKILSSDNLYNFDENLAVSLDLEALKETVKASDRVTNIFKIKTGSVPIHSFEERMLYYFECPVCKSFMKPPIYQCNSGHSICSSCKPRLEKCPTCRATFGFTRNYSLEGLTSGVQYPCVYHDRGCFEMAAPSEVAKHEATCPFKPCNCPFSNCTMNGSHDDVIAHLKQFHGDKVVLSDSQGYTESFKLEQTIMYNQCLDRKILIVGGHIFRLTCKRAGDFCLWAAELVGARMETAQQNFTYEVSIIDMRRPEKKLIRTDYVLNEMPDEELLKRCIMFPNTILASYTNNGMVCFHFRVKKCR